MPNPYGNPNFKPKYDEPTKVVRLPESLAERVTALLKEKVKAEDVLQQLKSLPLLDRSQLPAIPAIYLIYTGSRLLTIGRTIDLKQCVRQNKASFSQVKDVRIAWFEYDAELSLADLVEPGSDRTDSSSIPLQPSVRHQLQQFMRERKLSESEAIAAIMSEYFGAKKAGVTTSDRLAALEKQVAELIPQVAELRATMKK
jgi:hypothetical protein